MVRVTFFLSMMLCLSLNAQHNATNALVKHWKRAYLESARSVDQMKLTPSWAPDDSGFIYKREHNNHWSFLSVVSSTGKSQEAFDHQLMAQNLSKELKKKISPTQLPITFIYVKSLDPLDIVFQCRNSWFSSDGTSVKKSKAFAPKKKSQPSQEKHDFPSETSPDGKWKVTVKNGSVYLQKSGDSSAKLLAKPREKNDYYGGKPVWNEDSTHFYVLYTHPGQRRRVTLVESSPKDQLQPKTTYLRYDKPGDRIDRVEPHVFSVENTTVFQPDPNLTKNAFSISSISWINHGKELIYEYVERGFGKHYLLGINAQSGKQRVLAKEESDTFIYVGGVRFRKFLPQSNEIIWGSERDGWRHLYLIDSISGKVKNQITRGDWIVRSVEKIDPVKREITFTASGRNHGEDPYHIHWYRINFDGSHLTDLTQGDGMHTLQFSPQEKYYIDTWSRVDQPPVHELHRTDDGKKIAELARADISRFLKLDRKLPERFVCKDRNDRFDIWGIIQFPPHFDPKKKYPVIENIYAGPHGAFVPKPFYPWRGHLSELCEEGFIVVNIDGLGTNYRHHDFSHFSYKNLMDSGFPDRIKWIKNAAKSRPYMDLSRVGIYGGSAGGQSAMSAVLNHGDFYKAAAADSGCHDNRMDKIWWNESGWIGP